MVSISYIWTQCCKIVEIWGKLCTSSQCVTRVACTWVYVTRVQGKHVRSRACVPRTRVLPFLTIAFFSPPTLSSTDICVHMKCNLVEGFFSPTLLIYLCTLCSFLCWVSLRKLENILRVVFAFQGYIGNYVDANFVHVPRYAWCDEDCVSCKPARCTLWVLRLCDIHA